MFHWVQDTPLIPAYDKDRQTSLIRWPTLILYQTGADIEEKHKFTSSDVHFIVADISYTG